MELLQRFDQQVIHRKPHRPAPIRVARRTGRGGLRWFVVHTVFVPPTSTNVRIVSDDISTAPECHKAKGTRSHPASSAARAAAGLRSRSRAAAARRFHIFRMQEMLRQVRRLSRNHCSRRLKSGHSDPILGSSVSTANSGIKSYHRPYPQRVLASIGQAQARRRRSRRARPTCPISVDRRGGSSRARCR